MQAFTDTRPRGQAGRWLELSRHLAAPRALVFAAWSEAAHLRRWCAPAGMTVTADGADFREGGAWHAEMTGETGETLRVEGEYLEIGPGRRIVHTHRMTGPDGVPGPWRRVELTLADEGEGTRLSLRMGPFAADGPRQRHRLGWTETLDGLDRYLPAMIAADPAPASEPVIRLLRLLPVPPARVWGAWSDPEALARWWPPEGFALATQSFDFREGGLWRFTLTGGDGIAYPNRIRFLALDAPRHAAYRHESEDAEDESVFQSAVTLAETGGATRLTFTRRFASIEVRDNVARAFGAIESGQRALARLAAHLGADG